MSGDWETHGHKLRALLDAPTEEPTDQWMVDEDCRRGLHVGCGHHTGTEGER